MRTIETRAVRFGELAGPLVHGATFFDWQLVSTQEFAEAIGYPLEELIAADEIPYAPVSTRTRIDRYPAVGDRLAVETTPTHVGDHRIELRYTFLDGTGDPFGVGRISHVTISPDGTAKPLPETVQARTSEDITDTAITPEFELGAEQQVGSEPTYGDSFRIRRPLIEGSELAYFEEYPRLATISLERYLEEQAVSFAEIDDGSHLRLRRWEWSFNAPVAYGTTLDVNATVVACSEERVLVFHSFEQEGRPLIEGWSEYGCFDSDGKPVAVTERIRAALSVD